MTNLRKHQANSNNVGLLIQALTSYGADPQMVQTFLNDSLECVREVHRLQTRFDTYAAFHANLDRETTITRMELLAAQLDREIIMAKL